MVLPRPPLLCLDLVPDLLPLPLLDLLHPDVDLDLPALLLDLDLDLNRDLPFPLI